MYCEFVEEIPGVKICQLCQKTTATSRDTNSIKYICKAKQPKGLGDSTSILVDKITFGKGLQIAQTTASFLGFEDCGCNDRVDWLNKYFPYNSGNPNGV